ncbi:hypothetical protein UFOVP1004_42 [uncultured Caudovirales phage]|uniref:Uncharacterized protein n=1 Tax=uncultured Caudovirales phage TaxID=2100421 RepID=A0A6J5Q8U0_9CAUD|nr:hypothetical protein UFOVP1004_42 [uncultured Caudovirales phage]
MAISLEVMSGSSFTSLSLTGMGIHSFRLNVGYSAPAKLSFVIEADSHTIPLDYASFIRFSDDESPDGVVFEGWVEEVTPGSAPTGVNIVAYDPTYRASRMSIVMSAPDGSAASFPRAVWNCPNINDPDYAFSVGQNYSLGKIIKSILDTATASLQSIKAAPAGGAPYLTSDIGHEVAGEWVGNLQVKPEEKIVATSESPRSLIERLLATYEPTFRLMWEPGERIWRIHSLPDASAVTIKANDHRESVPVIACEVRRSAEGRHSAVKIYGPQGVEWKQAVWHGPGSSTGNTLEPIGADIYSIGVVGEAAQCYWSFAITDTDFNAIGQKGPYPISIPTSYFGEVLAGGDITIQLMTVYEDTVFPALVVEYPGGFRSVAIGYLDPRNGVVQIPSGQCLYLFDPDAVGNRYVMPVSVTLHYPNLTDPLVVRSPTSGYSGTVYSIGGIQSEYKEYNESLAVDYQYGVPITTATRIARMQKYADQLHSERKDLVHSGAIRFHGKDYRWAKLNKRVNIGAIEEDLSTLVTGWESIGAWVTDCEIDYEEMVTTVSMHTDQMELFGLDPEQLKRKLGIRPASWQIFFNWSVFYYYSRSMSAYAYELTQRTVVNVETTSGYYDDEGNIQ